jgi:hypothetical protein
VVLVDFGLLFGRLLAPVARGQEKAARRSLHARPVVI